MNKVVVKFVANVSFHKPQSIPTSVFIKTLDSL